MWAGVFSDPEQQNWAGRGLSAGSRQASSQLSQAVGCAAPHGQEEGRGGGEGGAGLSSQTESPSPRKTPLKQKAALPQQQKVSVAGNTEPRGKPGHNVNVHPRPTT